ncbi:unnamed protein product [Paramecium primaurelia]|uniref:Uncharacterized protein n=1 Tax=Paramecium primaurelia TaxID=5886 RepID=A0A8S1M3W0_PARPR|nr:unnamed protein product [Paramecium primaurelia]
MHRRNPIHRLFCSQNWTIKSQITLFSVLYIAFCILITTTLLVIFLNFTKDSLTKSTLTMERLETTNQMSRYNSLQTQSFNRVLNFSYQTLSNIDKLNHFIEMQRQNNFEITQPTNCIDNPKLWDKYIFNCSLCYKFCNKTMLIDESNYQQYLSLISLITQTLPILNLYRQTFFTSTGFEQFFTVFKGGDYTKFVAHIRPWYINHMNRTKYENHRFYLSDLYLDWINKLAIAFTVSLTNLEGDMIGVIGYDLAFDLLPYFVDQRLKMEIVNSTGHLLVSSYYEEFKYPTVIYNTSLTGFTKYDWQKMKQFGDDDNIGRGTLRVKNRKTMEFNEVSVYKMEYPQFYIIMYLYVITSYQTDDQFIKDQQAILDNLAKFDESILLGTIYFSLIILFSVLLIQFLIIKYVLNHLESLVLITKQQIFLKQRIKNKNVAINPDKDNTISKLCRSFLRLNQNLTNFKWKKSKLCRSIQKINYPRKNSGIDSQMCENFNNQIKQQIQQLEDYEDDNFTCFNKDLFKRLISRNKYLHKLFIQKYGTQ